jgi:hypothetical protein
MRTEADRWLGALFHGWVELVTLFLLLVAVLALLSWCWGRGLRPADRGPLVHAPMLLGTYGLVILLRQVQGEWWASLIVAFALLVGGLLSRVVRPVGLWSINIIVATLIGLHLHLSALAFTVAAVVALLFSSGQRR